MCLTDEERQLYNDLGIRINWDSISNEEWERMKQRNEKSKELENNSTYNDEE